MKGMIMANESGLSMTQKNGAKGDFSTEAAAALGGLPGMTVFMVWAGQTIKNGTTEVDFKRYGLFNVTKHGKTVKVRLLEGCPK